MARSARGADAAAEVSLVEAVDAGDRDAEIRALHAAITEAIADAETPPRDLAALSRRQLELGREIGGDRLPEMRVTRRRIAESIASGKAAPRDLAALSRRQLELATAIENGEAAKQEEAARGEKIPDAPLDPSTL